MSDLRFVRFDDVRTFLEVTKQADDYLMKNSGALSISDYLGAPTDPTRVFYLAIYRETLLMTLVYGIKEGFPWILSVHRRAEDILTPETLTLAVTLLANSISTLQFADPSIVSPLRVFGVEEPVNAFLTAWVGIQRGRGQRIRLKPNPTTVFVTYATRNTLTPLPPRTLMSPQHIISRASMSDLESLIPLYMNFFSTKSWPTQIIPTEALTRLQRELPTGLFWVCRTDGIMSAFAELGSVSPRTITIRTVYVPPEHRQRGVAEALVHTITRYYVGLGAGEMAVVPPGPPPEGVKEQVKLNVADAAAEELYRRLGFLLPHQSPDGMALTGGIDPATGRRGWYRSIWRESEQEPDNSTRRARRDEGAPRKRDTSSIPDVYIYWI
ncbi:hypothetical protein BD311DRAFT_804764 [Dichomitus squalens]|uniref:N-acetyltransferase domain-containing protein n=1 Tax=Dichomitus squalens TaxID=114155 RepID=A0A4Q9MTL4_9APHY|nr:hypothetical protein BD311DRAFT_804764 [Dichomitus squalens]